MSPDVRTIVGLPGGTSMAPTRRPDQMTPGRSTANSSKLRVGSSRPPSAATTRHSPQPAARRRACRARIAARGEPAAQGSRRAESHSSGGANGQPVVTCHLRQRSQGRGARGRPQHGALAGARGRHCEGEVARERQDHPSRSGRAARVGGSNQGVPLSGDARREMRGGRHAWSAHPEPPPALRLCLPISHTACGWSATAPQRAEPFREDHVCVEPVSHT
jgi:hypothetical protein